MKKTFTIIGIAAVLIVGLLALGHSGSSTPGVQQQQANVTESAGNNTGAQSAPNFTLQKLGGGTVSLADYKGKKPVVLDFWTTWCPNCQRDMPHLNAFYEKYKNQVEVIGIDMQEDPQLVAQTIALRGISYPIVLDPSSQVTTAYGINYTNVHVLIDKNGNLVRVIPGDIQESDIASLMK